MSYDAIRARAALSKFMAAAKLKEFPLEQAAGVAEGTIRAFRTGRTHSMTEETYVRLASAATEKLGRTISAAMLRGEGLFRQVPIVSRIGAGEEVFPFDGDGPIGWVDVPNGVDVTEAWQVDGDSMRPLYGPRDLLFPSTRRRDPLSLIGRIVGAQVKDGPRVVKQLQRAQRKNRFNLVSVNPAHATLEDRQLEWVALIAVAIYSD